MRLLTAAAGLPLAELPPVATVCHDVRDPRQRNDVLVRKGQSLTAHEITSLLARGVTELHLAVAQPGDIAEDAAARRLAAAVAGPAVDVTQPHAGQVSFTSRTRGVARIDAATLNQVNLQHDVLLLTIEPQRVVDVGDPLGVVKCAPLFLPEPTLQQVETLVAERGPVLEVQSFRSLRVGFVAPRERLRGGAFERAQTALSNALAWFGSTLDNVVGPEASVEGLAAAYRQLRTQGVDLILAAGATGTDPCDVVFEGLRRAGGRVEQIGIPAEPGTACWIGVLDSTAVLGLASCELFGQPGALDLLLPRLLTGESLDRDLLRRLALGGLLDGPSRLAPYHRRDQTASP
jgi:molybdenum cofactor cytidylyltransferase